MEDLFSVSSSLFDRISNREPWRIILDLTHYCFFCYMPSRSSKINPPSFFILLTLFSAALALASGYAYANDYADAGKLLKQGQHSQALEKINAYLAHQPKDAQARFLKGLVLAEQGKTEDAIKVFTALTEDYPDLPEPYNNLAVLYAGQGRYDQAKQLLEKAINTHPSYSTAHENLADIYAKMASQAYGRALQLDQGNTATQTKLALIPRLYAASKIEEAGISTTVATCAEPCNAGSQPQELAAVSASSVPASSVPLIPANKTETATLPADNNGDKEIRQQVWNTVLAWASAWSAKKVDQYLSFYAGDFKTPGGEPRSAWAKARKERISKPKHIRIEVHTTAIQFSDSEHVIVKFRQFYSASHLRTSSNKTLLMVKSGGKWLIQEEHS